jgi:hypothetical protein
MSLPNDDLDAAVETIVGRELPETSQARVVRPDFRPDAPTTETAQERRAACA